jgi:hypothetical protein
MQAWGDLTMWGIRAIRVAVVLCGSLATIAGSGCCSDCCQKLLGAKNTPPAQQTQQASESGQVPTAPNDWGRRFPQEEPSHLTPERVHGAIY